MKKISFIALALSTGVAFAQTGFSPTFGIKAGVNLAQFRTNDFPSGSAPDVSRKTSAHGGVFMNAPLGTGGFAIQPELLYSRQGSKMKQTTTIGTVTQTASYDQDMNYVTLPIMLQWKSTGGVFVETGPQPALLIQAQQDGPGSTKTDNKSSFDKFDLSWGAGLGYTTKVGLGIGARYVYGLTNTIEDNGGNNSSNNGPELKNSVIQIGLSWRFGGK
jgi:hypothetical protein